jgi:hypothetical protein
MDEEPDWLMSDAVEPDRADAMRFFVQPRWAPGSYSRDHGLRRRETPAYSEVEVLMTFDDGSVVGVVYILPRDDKSVLFATSFVSAFQPLRRALFGPGDERHRNRFVEELRRVRPLYITATANGLYDDLGQGALIQYNDPSDGVGKSLLVCVEGNRPPGADLLDERGRNTIGALLAGSFQLFEESLVPLDHEGMQRDIDFEDLLHTAGSAAKWLVENVDNLRTVVSILS